MAINFWVNSDLELFRISKEIKYLAGVSISKIWWMTDKQGRVKLNGVLPLSAELNNLEDSENIEILCTRFGPKDKYYEDNVIARLENIQIKRKWMLNISPQDPSNQEVQVLYLSLVCNVELLV